MNMDNYSNYLDLGYYGNEKECIGCEEYKNQLGSKSHLHWCPLSEEEEILNEWLEEQKEIDKMDSHEYFDKYVLGKWPIENE